MCAHIDRVRRSSNFLFQDNFFSDNSDHVSCLPRICVFVVLFLLEPGLFEFPCHTVRIKGGTGFGSNMKNRSRYVCRLLSRLEPLSDTRGEREVLRREICMKKVSTVICLVNDAPYGPIGSKEGKKLQNEIHVCVTDICGGKPLPLFDVMSMYIIPFHMYSDLAALHMPT